MDVAGTDRGASGWFAPVASAVAVAAVVFAGVGLSNVDLDADGSRGRQEPVGPDGGLQQVTHATNGQVAETFACPATIPYNFASGDSALEGAALDGPRAFADAMGAARFELLGGPEATVLRLGNEDGSLASLNTMHRERHGWVLDDMTACYGDDSMLVPAPHLDRLGVHDAEPWSLEEVFGGPADGVLVDDREYYNSAGLVLHRSLYVFPCAEDVCLSTKERDSVRAESVRGDGSPEDLSEFFLPEQPLQDRPPAYSFLAVYDAADEITRVGWEPARGGTRWVEPFEGGSWTGQLFLVLAPYDPRGTITTELRDGGVRQYDARGYALP